MHEKVRYMKEIGGYYIKECLYQGRRSEIYRGEKDGQPFIIKVPTTPHAETKLVHEFQVGQCISSNYVVKFLELISDCCYGHLLVEEDDRAESLLNIIPSQGFPPLEFLKIATQLAEGLQHIHESNIIHKDIKPSNIIIRSDSGKIKYIDFNSALVQRNNQQSISKDIATTQATLAYISPELTGRINQRVDYRTDFYSLGVTFYHLICGALPFTVKTVAELVHCHLAKQPSAPQQRDTRIPKPVSDVIMKMMEKSPESRYQSAYGLLMDLNRCLEEFNRTGNITPFTLGEQDIPEYFCIPTKLYGRETELSVLSQACDRVSQGSSQVIMIAGDSGSGKSVLVQELQPVIAAKGGYFLMGKYEAMKYQVPYHGIIQALQSWLEQILASTNEEIAIWKTLLLNQLGNQGQLMVDILPDLQLILGSQPPLPSLDGEQAKIRFHLVFQRFMAALTQSTPILLFLDDLQWSDPASLALLETIMPSSGTKHLLFIGTYRNWEASQSQAFMQTLDKIQSGVTIQTISLQPLSLSAVNHWTADAARRNSQETLSLAAVIFQKTAGCPFFVRVFMQSLYQQGLLTQVGGHWHWDLEKIRCLPVTENLISFLIQQIQQLPPVTQDVLQFISCVGHNFSLEMLHQIQEERPAGELALHLGMLVEKGLLVESEDEFLFAHDKVQEAVLQQLPQERELEIHLTIGRKLKCNSQQLVEAVDHLNRGKSLIIDESEQMELAKLNLAVGKKAKQDIAYASSLNYLKTAESCLHSIDIWEQDKGFAVQLHTELADVEHLNTHYQESRDHLDLLLQHTTDVLQKANIYNMLMVHFHTRAMYQETIDTGIHALQMLDVEMDTAHLETVHKEEWSKLRAKLSKIDTDSFLNMPQATDVRALMCMKLIGSTQVAAYNYNYLLHDVLVAKTMELILHYGYPRESAFGFITCGMVLIAKFGEISYGHALGLLSLRLSENSGNLVNICRCFILYSAFIHHWKLPMQQVEGYLSRAEQAGEAAGDYQYIVYCVPFKACYHFQSAIPLEEQEKELNNSLLQKPHIRCHKPVFSQIQALLLAIANLRGETPAVTIFQDSQKMDSEYLVKWKEEKQPAEFIFLVLKAQCLYLHGEAEAALAALAEAQHCLEFILGIILVPSFYLYSALAMLSLYPISPPDTQRIYLEKVEAHEKQLKTWAEECPENFLQKLLLVQAEKARVVTHDLWGAVEKYELAVQAAHNSGSLQDQALANELAANFLLSQDKPMSGRGFLQAAFQLYERWGAMRKVDQLVAKYGQVLKSAAPKLSSFSINGEETISANNLQMLDLTTILKTSQTISSEVDLRKLLDKILRILITTAGAQKAAFFIVESGELFVQAEYSIEGQAQLLQHQPLSQWHSGSRSIVDFVKRTRKSQLLDNALSDRRFAQDLYINRNHVQSVLCSPVLRHQELKAILYLENNLSPHVFSEQHMQILTLLGAQIAISLENSTCYDSIASLNEQLNLALQSGNVGTWCWYIQSNTMVADERFYGIFGADPNDIEPTKEGIIKLIHPDDRSAVEEAISRALTGLSFAVEHRVIKNDRSISTLDAAGKVICDDKGKSERMVGVVRDITIRKRLEQERLQALSDAEEKERRRAEEAEQYRTNLESFINQICHEIRNPMCGIFGNVDVTQTTLTSMKSVLDRMADKSRPFLTDYWNKIGECIGQIQQCVNHQKAIVDDVLDLSKLESSQNSLGAVSFSLKSAVNEVAQMFAAPLAIKNISFILSLPDSDPWVCGDVRRLKIALTNIVSNAVKFTEQGSIKISLELKEVTSIYTSFVISVVDTGIGMTAEVQSQLFQRFARVAAAEFEGSGLGLFLSKRFVECMGGKIEVYSKQGVGSKFSIVLQLMSSTPEVKCKPTFQSHSEPSSTPPMHVLVVEDNVVNQRILCRQLEQAGHHCNVAGNGQEALDKWKRLPFDLIFMDIEMPVMGGFEATQAIRKQEEDLGVARRVRIVGLSAFASPEFVQQAQAAGMNDYITKPYEKNKIYEAVAQCAVEKNPRKRLSEDIPANRKQKH